MPTNHLNFDPTPPRPYSVPLSLASVETPQQIFDWVAWNLLQQGRQCEDGNGNCLYRGPNGLRCAAGWLISDEDFATIEHLNGAASIRRLKEEGLLPSLLEDNCNLVDNLQRAHDNHLYKMAEWLLRMQEIAEDFNLDPSILPLSTGPLS